MKGVSNIQAATPLGASSVVMARYERRMHELANMEARYGSRNNTATSTAATTSTNNSSSSTGHTKNAVRGTRSAVAFWNKVDVTGTDQHSFPKWGTSSKTNDERKSRKGQHRGVESRFDDCFGKETTPYKDIARKHQGNHDKTDKRKDAKGWATSTTESEKRTRQVGRTESASGSFRVPRMTQGQIDSKAKGRVNVGRSPESVSDGSILRPPADEPSFDSFLDQGREGRQQDDSDDMDVDDSVDDDHYNDRN